MSLPTHQMRPPTALSVRAQPRPASVQHWCSCQVAAGQAQAGGTDLVRLMSLVTLLAGVGVGFVFWNADLLLSDLPQDVSWTRMHEVRRELDRYHSRHGKFPSTQQGLAALVTAGQLQEHPKDGYGNDLLYLNEGGRLTLRSYGRDGIPGGQGPDADLDHAELEQKQVPPAAPSRVEQTRRRMEKVAGALSAMRWETLRFPTREEGLGVLVRRGYLEAMPFDAWGGSFQYELRDGFPAIISPGADRAPGGSGEKADLELRLAEKGLFPLF